MVTRGVHLSTTQVLNGSAQTRVFCYWGPLRPTYITYNSNAQCVGLTDTELSGRSGTKLTHFSTGVPKGENIIP